MPEAPTAAPPAEPTTATLDAPAPTEKAPTEFMADMMGDFAEMDAGKPAPSVTRDEKGKFVKSTEKPTPKPAEKPKEKPVEKPLERPQETEPEKPTTEVKPVRAAELRNAYEGLKKKVKEELEPEVQRLRSKVQEYESKPIQEGGPLLEKLKAAEEKNKHLEERMAYLEYRETDDFQKNYQKPFNDAWYEASSTFQQLQVSERTPDGVDENGDPKFKINRRPATDKDLLRLANMPLQDMYDEAERMFGKASVEVVGQLRDLRRLSAAKSKAEEEAQKKAVDWKNQSSAQRAAEFQAKAKQLADTWEQVNKGLQEKFPKAFTVEENNADDKAGHTKGFALADLLFLGPQALTPEQIESLPSNFRDSLKASKPLTDVQKVQLHALARLKMANHDRQIVRLKKAQDRIKELETSLSEYEKSSPSAEKAGESDTKASSKDWLEEAGDELKAMDK